MKKLLLLLLCVPLMFSCGEKDNTENTEEETNNNHIDMEKSISSVNIGKISAICVGRIRKNVIHFS